MTIEHLEKMTTDLYRESGDRMPETAGADKDNWIAHHIEQAIQQKGPLLDDLLSIQSRAEVFSFLKKRYGEMTYGDESDRDGDD